MKYTQPYSAIFINGNPYAVVLPTSEAGKDQTVSMWDRTIAALGSHQNRLHFGSVFSWCQNSPYTDPMFRWVRGFSNTNDQDYEHPSTHTASLGYRPCLIPLNPETLQPDSSKLEKYKDGTTFCMGTLYMNKRPIDNPQIPTRDGDITDYIPGADLRIGESHEDPKYHIQWLKAGDCLIADRNLLKNISWDDLDKYGLVYGNQKQREIESIQDVYKNLSQLDPNIYAVARNMYYIANYFGNDYLSADELVTLAGKIADMAHYSNIPVLNEERLDAVCCLLSYGIDENRYPEFPEADAATTKAFLLSADIDTFSSIVDTAAVHNQDYYAPDNMHSMENAEQLQSVATAVQQFIDSTQDVPSLADKISHANSRATSDTKSKISREISK